jgi:molybdopterin converting factor small subunit
MTITVELFAAARELAGANEVAIDVSAGSTVRDVRAALAIAHAKLAGLAQRSRFATDREFLSDDAPLPPDGKLALIPPVSGG